MSRASDYEELDALLERKNELARRAAAARVSRLLRELRAWQGARLARTYADMRADPLAADAVRFFLSDLYGPQDLIRRDQDLARAWRLLKRALPPRALQVLSLAMELDVLSAQLDLEMAERLPPGQLTEEAYALAYRAVARPEDRRRQIELVVEVGRVLARAVRMPLVALALRAMHGPAHMAGFGALQDFLERGFAAFRKLPDPDGFLAMIERRETRLMRILMAGGTIGAQEPPASASGAI